MKTLLLNDSFPPVIDGVANAVMNYAGVLTEQNLSEVMVATPRYPDADYDGYPYPVIPYRSYDTSGLVHGYRTGDPFAADALEAILPYQPDIIHTHCPVASTILARIIRNETGAPIVFTYHTKFDVDIARAVKNQFLQKEGAKLLAENISYCDEVWTVSRGAGENLKSLGYEGEYRVMQNGVDFAKGRSSAEEVREIKETYHLGKDIPVFLFVGRIMKYKGLPLIVDALSLLSASGEDFRMLFVGGGSDLPEMVKYAVEKGLATEVWGEDGSVKEEGTSDRPGRVIFTGPERNRNRLRAFNTAADLFLFPSTYDTNGIVVREAAACGLASVLIKDSCAAEEITDQRNGFVIEETGEAMFRLLKTLSGDREKMKQTGQRAMDEIYLSWEDAVKRAYERYQQILELKRGGKLPVRKKEASDYFLNAMASLTEGTERAFHMPRSIRDGMLENWTLTREEWSEQIRDMKTELRSGMHDKKTELVDGMHEKKTEWNEQMQLLKEEWTEQMEEMWNEWAEKKELFRNKAAAWKEQWNQNGQKLLEKWRDVI